MASGREKAAQVFGRRRLITAETVSPVSIELLVIPELFSQQWSKYSVKNALGAVTTAIHRGRNPVRFDPFRVGTLPWFTRPGLLS